LPYTCEVGTSFLWEPDVHAALDILKTKIPVFTVLCVGEENVEITEENNSGRE
jgi:hypothetical protein